MLATTVEITFTRATSNDGRKWKLTLVESSSRTTLAEMTLNDEQFSDMLSSVYTTNVSAMVAAPEHYAETVGKCQVVNSVVVPVSRGPWDKVKPIILQYVAEHYPEWKLRDKLETSNHHHWSDNGYRVTVFRYSDQSNSTEDEPKVQAAHVPGQTGSAKSATKPRKRRAKAAT